MFSAIHLICVIFTEILAQIGSTIRPVPEIHVNRTAFEQLVEKTLGTLPTEYAGQLHNLVFLIEDWADPETIAEVGFDDPAELLGFYSGTPLTERSHDQIDYGPDRVTLYQGAIEREASLSGLPVRLVIRETLWHEIAHYFGFSEEEMDRIEDFWADQNFSESQ